MEMKRIYDLIYELAPQMDLNAEELERLLCNADVIAGVEANGLHGLLYKLAEEGFLDEESLNNFLHRVDEIEGS